MGSHGFEIRKFEVQNPKPFIHVVGTGNNPTEIILPKGFVYGNYLYLRDVLFLYRNNYNEINFEFTERLSTSLNNAHFNCRVEDTKVGDAIFIDRLIRPQYNRRYFYSLTNLPAVPEKYGLFHKLHYRLVTMRELEDNKSYYGDFFLQRQLRPEPAPLRKQAVVNQAIVKYTCFICKRFFDLKDVQPFVLRGKKQHLCNDCYEAIPYLDTQEINLKKV